MEKKERYEEKLREINSILDSDKEIVHENYLERARILSNLRRNFEAIIAYNVASQKKNLLSDRDLIDLAYCFVAENNFFEFKAWCIENKQERSTERLLDRITFEQSDYELNQALDKYEESERPLIKSMIYSFAKTFSEVYHGFIRLLTKKIDQHFCSWELMMIYCVFQEKWKPQDDITTFFNSEIPRTTAADFLYQMREANYNPHDFARKVFTRFVSSNKEAILTIIDVPRKEMEDIKSDLMKNLNEFFKPPEGYELCTDSYDDLFKSKTDIKAHVLAIIVINRLMKRTDFSSNLDDYLFDLLEKHYN